MTTTIEQPAVALREANRVRLAQAGLKRELHALPYWDGRRRAAILFEAPPEWLLSMRVGVLLLAVRRVGDSRIREWCSRAGIRSFDRRVRELTDRQREMLAAALREGKG